MNIKHTDDIKDQLTPELKEKLENLKKIIIEMKSLVVAFSGGTDSAFLLKVAYDTINDKTLAVIGKSDTYAESEISGAVKTAELIGANSKVIETCELFDDKFASNPTDRCYHCKNELFSKLLEAAEKDSFNYVADGSNYEDLKDYRPGMKAAVDLNVRSPLVEAKFIKSEIIEVSRLLGLPTWNKPPQPCLSSRFPYGTKITKERLEKVAKAEEFLSNLGLKQFRVRYHNEIARIEALREDMALLIDEQVSSKIHERFKEIGFLYTTIDIKGYRMGSMNEGLKAQGQTQSPV